MNNQGKVELALSERDKMMLIILLIIGIIFCSYYFGYRNINAMTLDMQEQTDELTAKYQALYPLYQRKDDYIAETKTMNEDYDKKVAGYASNTTQESLILTASAIEQNIGVWFSTITISDIAPVYTFGQIVSSNPSNQGASVYTTDMIGHKSTLTMAYQVNYEECKKMIKYLNENKEQEFTIESMSMTYDEGEEQVSGSITVAMYDITGSARPYVGVDVYNVPIGTDNIFRSRLMSSIESLYVLLTHDIYVSISDFVEGTDNVRIGLGQDALAKTMIGAEGNALQTATLTITGKNGDYKVSYKLGDKQYPVENFFDGAALDCGDTLDLLVISSEREGEDDKSSVKLNIANSSDKTVNLYVYGDDGANPRFALGTTTGSVNVVE